MLHFLLVILEAFWKFRFCFLLSRKILLWKTPNTRHFPVITKTTRKWHRGKFRNLILKISVELRKFPFCSHYSREILVRATPNKRYFHVITKNAENGPWRSPESDPEIFRRILENLFQFAYFWLKICFEWHPTRYTFLWSPKISQEMRLGEYKSTLRLCKFVSDSGNFLSISNFPVKFRFERHPTRHTFLWSPKGCRVEFRRTVKIR